MPFCLRKNLVLQPHKCEGRASSSSLLARFVPWGTLACHAMYRNIVKDNIRGGTYVWRAHRAPHSSPDRVRGTMGVAAAQESSSPKAAAQFNSIFDLCAGAHTLTGTADADAFHRMFAVSHGTAYCSVPNELSAKYGMEMENRCGIGAVGPACIPQAGLSLHMPMGHAACTHVPCAMHKMSPGACAHMRRAGTVGQPLLKCDTACFYVVIAC